ncbi:hypothetical protein COT20_01865 [bacterium (Candidatus Gribaldobacteria) CG08_land_8_20_14_0_20_39_15]|uniref:Polymerase beta nucleotidyltransferase domain-containing protein n=1 Tax=bacterium (Candidatus Gribaldobacteria) CG08_land_8_20_14_0_20_39_15 TaxID=2014273 RepID=A0A2M6XUA2_9BACT|nr:MAG: hypothetical protein COT20_01865 [bacterium (Candidatus Gribaldobacteria) CG08_land_8_20_14_0_20_39_15]
MEIQREQKQMAEELVKKHELEFAVVFGSQANGQTRKDSDLDIGILDPKPETYKRYGDLYNDFSKVFKGQNVDLRMIKGAEPVFLYNTLMKGKFLAGQRQIFSQYQAFAYKNFVDSKPLFELKEKLLLKRQKKINKMIKNVR